MTCWCYFGCFIDTSQRRRYSLLTSRWNQTQIALFEVGELLYVQPIKNDSDMNIHVSYCLNRCAEVEIKYNTIIWMGVFDIFVKRGNHTLISEK